MAKVKAALDLVERICIINAFVKTCQYLIIVIALHLST